MSDNGGAEQTATPGISPAAALADVVAPADESRALEERFDERFGREAIEAERAWAKLIGLRDHFRHKGNWSWFLMGLMGFMVLFQSLLIVMVGGGWWDFTKYAWLLPTLMIQYLLQVAGLALVAVRSLFKDLD
ncbi:MAG: hypothetical protein ACHP9T_07315 [Caulobacterales bacterium]